MNLSNKEKKNISITGKKKRINWNQNLKSTTGIKLLKATKIKKSLQYVFLLKKFKNIIDFKNLKLLRGFLNKYGKILARRKTRITVQRQRKISNAIRKARAFGLLPFICDLNI
jgi:ribosomal protein S18